MSRLKLPTLLAVTDRPPVRYWMKGQLEESFFIIHASNQKKTLEAAQTAHLDFIIVDAAIEECDPIILCKELRKLTPLIPILLITGRLKASYRNAALQAGVTDFLTDQLDPEELKQQIIHGKKAEETRNKLSKLTETIPDPELIPTYSENKNCLDHRIIKFLDSANKQSKEMILLVAQIDEFTTLANPQELLSSVSNRLRQAAPNHPILTSMNNSQLMILLSDTDLIASTKLAQHFQKIIEQHPFKTELGPIHITASFAVSKLNANQLSLDKTIRASVLALKSCEDKNTILNLEKSP